MNHAPQALVRSHADLTTRGASRRWTAAVVSLALAGVGLVLLSTARYGAGLSPDSVAYLDVARSLASGKGFVSHTGEPLVWWPPLYPMLLALIGFATGLDHLNVFFRWIPVVFRIFIFVYDSQRLLIVFL